MRNPFRNPFSIVPASLAVITFAAIGCHSTPTSGSDGGVSAAGSAVMPSLVTMPEDSRLAAADPGWETARNDPPERARTAPDHSWTTFIEVRHREHLRTTNARPREHSTTRTQTIHRRGQRR